jgi:hypothetical protein
MPLAEEVNMENALLLLLGFGFGCVGLSVGALYFGSRDPYDEKKALIDTLSRPDRSPWDIINARCSYCNGKLSLVTDRCTHCGAPK